MSTYDANSRRGFLKRGAVLAGAAALPLQSFWRQAQAGAFRNAGKGYGKLKPVADEATGLKLLSLPEGFRYLSYGWTGDPLDSGLPTPDAHDGMGVIKSDNGLLTICRNHEITLGTLFASEDTCYDPKAGGGCVNLQFDSKAGKFVKSWGAITGTLRNCAGGPTPWQTWLTCEETVLAPGEMDDDKKVDLDQDHGWIFETPADAASSPKPLKDMGRFVHEAVAVDPQTKIVYETEDRGTSGFYRFLPNKPGDLAQGGRLQMMKVAGLSDARTGVADRGVMDVSWIDIDDPTLAHTPGTKDELGVYRQGKRQGGATFARLEGCWHGDGKIYFVATSGGDAGAGQVWEHDPVDQQVRLVFESPSAAKVDHPDNITVSPRGGIILCEDGNNAPQRLHGLTREGQVFPFAANNVQLKGERNGIAGDFRGSEWAGATFSPDGKWLFVNIQTPGITFAITGPWESGAL